MKGTKQQPNPPFIGFFIVNKLPDQEVIRIRVIEIRKRKADGLTLPRRRRSASVDTGRRKDSSDPHWSYASHLWHK